MPSEVDRIPYDAESEIAAIVVGSGTVLIQASALFIGLLPCLLLLLPLALPLLVLPLLALPVVLAVRIGRLAMAGVRWLRSGRTPVLVAPRSEGSA
jgi:hypothetical protein